MTLYERITHAIQTYVHGLSPNTYQKHATDLLVIEWVTPKTHFVLKKKLFLAGSVHNFFISETAEKLMEMAITDQDILSIYLENPQNNEKINHVETILNTDLSLIKSPSMPFFHLKKNIPNVLKYPPPSLPIKPRKAGKFGLNHGPLSKLATVREEPEETESGTGVCTPVHESSTLSTKPFFRAIEFRKKSNEQQREEIKMKR